MIPGNWKKKKVMCLFTFKKDSDPISYECSMWPFLLTSFLGHDAFIFNAMFSEKFEKSRVRLECIQFCPVSVECFSPSCAALLIKKTKEFPFLPGLYPLDPGNSFFHFTRPRFYFDHPCIEPRLMPLVSWLIGETRDPASIGSISSNAPLRLDPTLYRVFH